MYVGVVNVSKGIGICVGVLLSASMMGCMDTIQGRHGTIIGW